MVIEHIASIASLIIVLAIIATMWANPGGTAQIFDAGGKTFTSAITAAKH